MIKLIPARRTGKVVLGLAAAAITGLAITGGTVAANAAPAAPAAPAVVANGGAAALEVANCTVDLAPTAAGGKDKPVVVNSECTGTGGLAAPGVTNCTVDLAPTAAGGKDKSGVVNSECSGGEAGECAADLAAMAAEVYSKPAKIGGKPEVVTAECEQG